MKVSRNFSQSIFLLLVCATGVAQAVRSHHSRTPAEEAAFMSMSQSKQELVCFLEDCLSGVYDNETVEQLFAKVKDLVQALCNEPAYKKAYDVLCKMDPARGKTQYLKFVQQYATTLDPYVCELLQKLEQKSAGIGARVAVRAAGAIGI